MFGIVQNKGANLRGIQELCDVCSQENTVIRKIKGGFWVHTNLVMLD